MLLSSNKIAQIVIFIAAFGGIFIFGKLPIWIALTGLILPFLVLDVLVNRPKVNRSVLFFLVILVVVSIVNFQHLKLTTAMYSLFLMTVFLFSRQKIERCKPEFLIGIYRNVILVFFILLITGLCFYFLLGVNDFPLTRVDVSRGFPRSFGPTTEPSYAALTLTIAMLVLCSSVNNTHIEIRLLLFIYIISIIIIGSGIGYLACTILLMYIFYAQSLKVFKLEKIAIIISSVMALLFLSDDIERLKPLFDVLSNILKYDSLWNAFNAFKIADSSAWFRFGPFFEYLRDMQLSELDNILIGNGAGTSTSYFGEKYIMHIDPDWFDSDGKPVMDLPFLPAFLYDYGIILTFILIYIFKCLIKPLRGSGFFILIALFIVFNSNFNTSIFWFFVYSLLVINVVQKKEFVFEKN
ncbi:hypothetical protein WN093_11350 [Gammaproteobacteria bacterium AS21]